jgi:hypothetical protein
VIAHFNFKTVHKIGEIAAIIIRFKVIIFHCETKADHYFYLKPLIRPEEQKDGVIARKICQRIAKMMACIAKHMAID